MGTEAQQALQRRTQALSPGGGARNVEGTRQAQQQAIRRNAQPGHIARRKPQQQQQRGDQYGREFGDGQVGAGYGGMGYGPTADNTPEFRKTQTRVDPSALTRQLLDKVTRPAVQNYRPEGSIWDDPNFKGLANEQGPNIAIKARNLQRKIDATKEWQQSRISGQRNQLAIDEGKLYDQQLQHQMRQYAPGQQQSVGTQDVTGVERDLPGRLAVDAGGAFTGEGKQAGMVGPGPQQQPPAPDMKSQAQLVESYAKILEDRRMPEDVKNLVREELRKTLSGGQTNTSQSPWPEYPDAFEENGQWFVERGGKRFRLEFEE